MAKTVIPGAINADPAKIANVLEIMNKRGHCIGSKYGYESKEMIEWDQAVKDLRVILASIPGTKGDERCSLHGCPYCDINDDSMDLLYGDN